MIFGVDDDNVENVVWRKHPCRRLTRARFAGLEHVRRGGVVDKILADRQLARRVAVQVPALHPLVPLRTEARIS